MLIEVPRGMTKLQMRLETLALFSTQSIVMGRVAAEELVEKAVRRAGAIALKWRIGLMRATNFKSNGRQMNMKVISPKRTERVNQATGRSVWMPVDMKTLETRAKTP